MKIGFIGLGLMGEAMSLNLVKKSGHPVSVFDLDPAKVAVLTAAGATAAASIREVGESCDVVISMVPKSEHVQAVYRELLPVARAGQILIDMSTIDVAVSVELSEQAAKTGAIMLDAPVVKSVPAAKDGTLGIYVGGDKAAFEQVQAILACMGCNIIHLGTNGRGLVMKLAHNVLVAEIQNGVNEMLTVAHEFGISTADFATAVSYGGASNFYLTSKLNALKAEDYTTAFSLENMGKDIDCMVRMAEPKGLKLPGVLNCQSVYNFAIENSMGREDFCASIKAVKLRAH